MRTLAIVAAVWFLASLVFAIGWARFHRRMDAPSVVAEAERILVEASRS